MSTGHKRQASSSTLAVPAQALKHEGPRTPAEVTSSGHSLDLTGHKTLGGACPASSWVSGDAHTGTGSPWLAHPRISYTGNLAKPGSAAPMAPRIRKGGGEKLEGCRSAAWGTSDLAIRQLFGELGMKEAKGKVCCVSWVLRNRWGNRRRKPRASR